MSNCNSKYNYTCLANKYNKKHKNTHPCYLHKIMPHHPNQHTFNNIKTLGQLESFWIKYKQLRRNDYLYNKYSTKINDIFFHMLITYRPTNIISLRKRLRKKMNNILMNGTI